MQNAGSLRSVIRNLASTSRLQNEPNSIVTYMPNGRFGRMIWPVIFGIPMLASIAFGVELLIPCSVTCDRSIGTCSAFVPSMFAASTTSVPIDAIRGTQVATSTNKAHETTYMLNLVGPQGEISTATFYSTDQTYAGAKTAIDSFLADKSQSKLAVMTAASSSGGYAVLGVSLIWFLIIWLLLQWAQVVVDWRARTLTIVRHRWPLPPKTVTFPLDLVHDAHVTYGAKGSTGVALSIDHESREVPLLASKSSGSGPKERAVAEIRALLARRDSER